jgi:hypothetical protein
VLCDILDLSGSDKGQMAGSDEDGVEGGGDILLRNNGLLSLDYIVTCKPIAE